MKTTDYLYGINPNELEDKLYFDALRYKYHACTRLYRQLYLTPNKTEEQLVQLFHVGKAQAYTKKLLDERLPQSKPQPYYKLLRIFKTKYLLLKSKWVYMLTTLTR